MKDGQILKSATQTELKQWAGQIRDYTGRDSLVSFETLVPDAVKRFNCLYADGEKEDRCWVKAHVANRYIVGSEARDRRFIRSCLEAMVLEELSKAQPHLCPRVFGSVYHREEDGKFTHIIFQENLNHIGYQELSKLAGNLSFPELVSVLREVLGILRTLNNMRFTIALEGLPEPLKAYFQRRMRQDEAGEHYEVTGVAHCDIRPENIFVERFKGQVRVRLVDYELAKFLSQASYEQSDFDKTPLTTTLAGVHFQQYACLSAFKQYKNRVKHYVNVQTDLFSVGIVTMYLLLNETPGNFLDERFFAHLQRYLKEYDPGYCQAMGFPDLLDASAGDLNDLYYFCAPFLFGGSEKPLKSNIPLNILFNGFLRFLENSADYAPLFSTIHGSEPFKRIFEARHQSYWSLLCGLRFMSHERMIHLPLPVRVLLYDLVVSMTAPTVEARADIGLNPYQTPAIAMETLGYVLRLERWLRSGLDIEDPNEIQAATEFATAFRHNPGVCATPGWSELLIGLVQSPHFPQEIHQGLLAAIAEHPIYLNNELILAIRAEDPDIRKITSLVGKLRRCRDLPASVAENLKALEAIIAQ